MKKVHVVMRVEMYEGAEIVCVYGNRKRAEAIRDEWRLRRSERDTRYVDYEVDSWEVQ